MDHDKLINNIFEEVKKRLPPDPTSHDWEHAQRVRKLSLIIANTINNSVDLIVVELAALLHDIKDWKFCKENEKTGPEIAQEILTYNNCSESRIIKIVDIIKYISFKGNIAKNLINSIEGEIVQDADRLDAMGAIGIARAFAYGGFTRKQLIFSADCDPRSKIDEEEYMQNKCASTINHFYEKLLLLKDMMNTQKGREIAQTRHEFLLKYLQTFYDEWNVNI